MDKLEAINFIEDIHHDKESRFVELMAYFNNIQDDLKIIHVAGSNGKGSTCAMLSSILSKAHYKVGTFISPHLIEYNERFLIDGKCISDDEFISLANKVSNACGKLNYRPKFFEKLTCMAFLYFYNNNCDYVVLEVGLGGRLDATNIIKHPLLSIIMNIGLEHTAILGDTIEKIAYEKGGIIKENSDVLSYDLKQVLPVYEDICKKKNAVLYVSDFSKLKLNKNSFDYKEYKNISLSLKGDYQVYNCAVVLDAVSLLNKKGLHISLVNVLDGLNNTKWDARMMVLNDKPLFILDGAHNGQCAKALALSLKSIISKPITFLIGILNDKNVDEIIKYLGPLAKEFVCVAPNTYRAIDSNTLKEKIVILGYKAISFEKLKDGLAYALESDVVVGCGSLYLSGEIISTYKKYLRSENRKKIAGLSKSEVNALSKKIVDNIRNSEAYKKSKNIMLYMAKDNEIDLSGLLNDDKIFSFPVCMKDNQMKAMIPKDNHFILNKYGILEPDLDSKEMIDIDLIICPLSAFDDNLNRIGKGKGYYDRFLANKISIIAGVAYSFLKVYRVPDTCFDKNLDIIYCEDRVLKRI